MLGTLGGWQPDTWVAIGTIALAAVTLVLAVATAAQVRTSRRALQAAVRPLIVDMPLPEGEADATSDADGVVEIELPLRNGGTGLALIVGGPRLVWQAFPTGWSGVSQQLVVLPGESLRLTFRQRFGSAESANQAALSANEFSIEVEYTDGDGKQKTRTKAYVVQHPEEMSDVDLFVDRIEISSRRAFRWGRATTLTGRSRR